MLHQDSRVLLVGTQPLLPTCPNRTFTHTPTFQQGVELECPSVLSCPGFIRVCEVDNEGHGTSAYHVIMVEQVATLREGSEVGVQHHSMAQHDTALR